MLIKNGRIIDPANGVDEVNDLLIEDGKVVSIGKVEDDDGEAVRRGGADSRARLRGSALPSARSRI